MNNSTNNKVTNFPSPVNDDEVFFPLLNSPKQEARREALRRRDRNQQVLSRAFHSFAMFSAGVVFLWLLMLL